MPFAYRLRYRIATPPSEGDVTLYQLPIRIGRNVLNHCCLAHPYISDFHAVLEQVQGRLCIRDLRSKNGIHTPAGERMAEDGPVPISVTNNTFLVGRVAQIYVEEVQADQPAGARPTGAAGSVLGNRQMLQAGIQGDQRPSAVPVPSVADRPAWRPEAPPPVAAPAGHAGWSSPPPRADSAPPGVAPRTSLAAHDALPRNALATAQLSMEPETLALQGLRELGASLVGGPSLRTTGDVARLITKLHDTVEVFCRCFVPLREGYSKFISSFDLRQATSQRGLNRSQSALRVEAANDPATVAGALLDWRNQDFDAPEAVAAIFADLMAHQIALVEGVMEGVRALLEELSPEAIENAARDEPGGLSTMLGRHRVLWQTFRKRYEELAAETRKFELVFGSEFAAAYRDYAARQSKA